MTSPNDTPDDTDAWLAAGHSMDNYPFGSKAQANRVLGQNAQTTTVAELQQIIQARIEYLRKKIAEEPSVTRRFDLAGRALNLENCLALIGQALKGFGSESHGLPKT